MEVITHLRNRYHKNLHNIDLPLEIKEGISSRSSMLSSTLKTISEEDLIQEGLLTVYEVIKRKPNAPLPFIMKALNNRYSVIRKKEVKYKKKFQSLNSEKIERELEQQVTRQHYNKEREDKPNLVEDILANRSSGQLTPIVLLKEQGMSFKDIAKYLGRDVKTIRKILKDWGKNHGETSDM